MNSTTILKLIKKDKSIPFLNVFARNELPQKPPYPSCFIFNTEPRHEDGEHWLAIYINSNGNAYFFAK